MTLLLQQNLGTAWGANAAPAAPTANKTLASPKSAGAMKTRG